MNFVSPMFKIYLFIIFSIGPSANVSSDDKWHSRGLYYCIIFFSIVSNSHSASICQTPPNESKGTFFFLFTTFENRRNFADDFEKVKRDRRRTLTEMTYWLILIYILKFDYRSWSRIQGQVVTIVAMIRPGCLETASGVIR